MADSAPKPTVKRQIDENLKRIYDETLQEKVPDRLTQLLQQLREKGQVKAAESTTEGDQ